MSRAKVTAAEITRHAEQFYGPSQLPSMNGLACTGVDCLVEKVLTHRAWRHWNQWQSLLLHRYIRYAWPQLQCSRLVLKCIREPGAVPGSGVWFYSMANRLHWENCDGGAACPAMPKSPEDAGTRLYVAEVWEEIRGTDRQTEQYAARFHNLFIVQVKDKAVVIPFDVGGEQLAKQAPFSNPFMNLKVVRVLSGKNPFVPLFWFHYAMTHRDAYDVIGTLQTQVTDVSGSALFEMHLIDVLLPSGCQVDLMKEHMPRERCMPCSTRSLSTVPLNDWKLKLCRDGIMQPYKSTVPEVKKRSSAVALW